MATLEVAFLVMAALFGVATLGYIKIKYDGISREIERDCGWHLMWHERIMDEKHGRDTGS